MKTAMVSWPKVHTVAFLRILFHVAKMMLQAWAEDIDEYAVPEPRRSVVRPSVDVGDPNLSAKVQKILNEFGNDERNSEDPRPLPTAERNRMVASQHNKYDPRKDPIVKKMDHVMRTRPATRMDASISPSKISANLSYDTDLFPVRTSAIIEERRAQRQK